MTSGAENASINLICDVNGIVLFQSRAADTGDDWASGEAVAPHVGKPLVKTYWFDHLDCDHRDLLQLIRKAAAGAIERGRVWMRVDENQLVRAELTATPLTDESGQTRSVLVRTEPTYAAKRKRDNGEPVTKLMTAERPGDLLQIRLSVPMLRVEVATGSVVGANDAAADLLGRTRDQILNLPLTEIVAEADRRPLIEVLAAFTSEATRAIDLRLLNIDGVPISARLSLCADPHDADRTAIIVIRDLSTEEVTQDLLRRADAMTSVMVRNAERMQLLEAFFERSPLGLAIFDRGQLVRANRAFDAARTDELLRQIDAAATVDGAQVYRIGETEDAPLAVIAGAPAAEGGNDASWSELLARQGCIALLETAEDEALALRAGTMPVNAATLSELFEEPQLADVRSMILVARTGQPVEPLETRLAGDHHARLSVTRSADGRTLLLLNDLTPERTESQRLALQVQAQSDAIAELSARASAVDPAQFAQAIAATTDLRAQIQTLVSALEAGTFTWDVEAGRIDADARAHALLEAGEDSLTPATLLAAATHDERRTFEQRYFDAVSGDRRIDLQVHIGPDHRPVRIIGHVLVTESEAGVDPRALVAVVLDQRQPLAAADRAAELERQLALRTAELNAILESSRDAIRIKSAGTLRHNSAAGELFSDDINAFLDVGSAAASERAIHSSTAPIVVNGEVFGVVSVSSDQSDLTQLRRREAEVAAILANTGIAMAVLDADYRLREVNASLCALLGYAPAQLVGQLLRDFVHADDGTVLTSEFDAVNSDVLQSCTSDLRLLRRDGEPHWVHLTVTRPRAAEQEPQTLIILAQDIQELVAMREERSRMEMELATARAQRALLEATTQDALLRLDLDGRIIDANEPARTLLRLNGRSNLRHLTFVAPETGRTLSEPLPWSRATTDRARVVELRVLVGETPALVGRVSYRADDDGNVALSVTDVTRIHSMQEELQKAYARIVESHTLLQNRTRLLEGNFVSAVQQLGASIASAYGSAKAVRNDTRLPGALKELAARVVDAFRVHRRLVQHFSASAATTRSPAGEEMVDVHALANDAAQTLAERFSIAGRLELSLDAVSHHARLDGAMIRHALWSIFAHAVSQAGKTPARVHSSSLATTRGDGKLRLRVEWPGTRTGTAELNLADALISSCGGTFSVESGDHVSLATIEFDTESPDADAAPTAQTPRHVLLVEDHESTSRVLRRQLERLGCVVSLASDLAGARSVLEDRADVELIICDLSLPDEDLDASLRDLLRRIDMPAIALRGYGGAEAPEDLLAMGFVDHIDKPVDLNALSAAIARFATTAGE